MNSRRAVWQKVRLQIHLRFDFANLNLETGDFRANRRIVSAILLALKTAVGRHHQVAKLFDALNSLRNPLIRVSARSYGFRLANLRSCCFLNLANDRLLLGDRPRRDFRPGPLQMNAIGVAVGQSLLDLPRFFRLVCDLASFGLHPSLRPFGPLAALEAPLARPKHFVLRFPFGLAGFELFFRVRRRIKFRHLLTPYMFNTAIVNVPITS